MRYRSTSAEVIPFSFADPRAVDLNLAGCTNLVDIRGVRGVRSADLTGCTAIVDISPLSHSRTVVLRDCISVRNVSPLVHAETVVLARCTLVNDVSQLKKVHTLLCCCTGCTVNGDTHSAAVSHPLRYAICPFTLERRANAWSCSELPRTC